jgi:hypothetical protein
VFIDFPFRRFKGGNQNFILFSEFIATIYTTDYLKVAGYPRFTMFTPPELTGCDHQRVGVIEIHPVAPNNCPTVTAPCARW